MDFIQVDSTSRRWQQPFKLAAGNGCGSPAQQLPRSVQHCCSSSCRAGTRGTPANAAAAAFTVAAASTAAATAAAKQRASQLLLQSLYSLALVRARARACFSLSWGADARAEERAEGGA